MFLHLGGKKEIFIDKIISINDYNEFIKTANYEIIENNQNNNKVVFLAQKEFIKSIVITDDVIFLSPISVNTLAKRVNNGTEVFKVLR